MKKTKEIKEYLRKMASNGGKKSASNMTPEERKERARKAGLGNRKKLSPETEEDTLQD